MVSSGGRVDLATENNAGEARLCAQGWCALGSPQQSELRPGSLVNFATGVAARSGSGPSRFVATIAAAGAAPSLLQVCPVLNSAC